jgi:hypothetical protein
MTRHSHRLAAWQRAGLFASGGVLVVTGGAWLALHYGFGAGANQLPHPLEAWSMRLHGLAAFVALFMLGTLATSHIPHGWRMTSRRLRHGQRGSGLGLCSLAAGVVLSGYLLYYFAPEPVRPALGWAHALAGFAMAGLVIFHMRPKSRHLPP